MLRTDSGLKLGYIGDGNNVLHSLLLLAPFLGIHLQYSCPMVMDLMAVF